MANTSAEFLPMSRKITKLKAPAAGHEPAFREIIGLIAAARRRAFQAVNIELIDLYWRVGEYIHQRIGLEGWGKATILSLAEYIRLREPGVRGFSSQNLWRMRQFYEVYHQEPKLSPLVRVLSWTHNLLILSGCKRAEEREFYLRMATSQGWSKRELERQLNGSLFSRAVLNPPKVSAVLRQLHPAAEIVFKDTYLLDFLELPKDHSERQLQKALVANLKQFLIELGPDFCFAGEELRFSVGGQDFYLDLLFYHRGLQCLVAFDLKIRKFEPEHLGKMEFYLEALDRDVRKPNERPSIGVLLCANKDSEVVEYALSRSMSPALIAEYQTRLPDKRLLQRKLHEFYQLAMPKVDETKSGRKTKRAKKR
jgi:predicted nuclease of restriction endonuclease-like (RecB) superfamily